MPRQVGRYVVAAELGRGGMGVVVRGRDPSLQRDVAIKLCLDGTSERERERFRREALAAARLKHPGIVGIHEVGEQDGRPFLVMELVDGDAFDQLVEREGKLPPRRAAEIVRDLAVALAHAHAQGVIHRDLKPQNVLIGRDGHPRLVDFGLARTIDADSQLTRSGQLIGTPQYVSPEAANGDVAVMGPRSDVFGLGGILYWALTGRPPFEGSSVLEIISRVFNEDPEPARSIDPTVHIDLETIAARCLEKRPEQRYGSADEVAAELGRFVDGEAILARPLGRGARAARWARRHPARLAALALGVVVVAGGPASLIVQRTSADRARARGATDARAELVAGARVAAGAALTAFAEARARAAEEREASPEDARRRTDRLLALGLAAFSAGQRLEALAGDDPDGRRLLFDAAMGLGEVAVRAEQWSVATTAFERAGRLGVDDLRARAAADDVAAARARVADEHRRIIEDVLDRVLSGAIDESPVGFEEALFTLVRYPETQTVALLTAALDEVTTELRAVIAELLLEAGGPEGPGGAVPGIEEAVAVWLEGGSPPEGENGAIRHALGEATRRLDTRIRADRPAQLQPMSVKEHMASAQSTRVGEARLRLARICCEALGWIGIREGAIDPLGRFILAIADERRAAPAGVALCLLATGRPEDDAATARYLERAREGWHSQSYGEFWRRLGPLLSRVGLEEAIDLSGAEGTDAKAEAGAHFDRGINLCTRGDLRGGVEQFVKAVALDPGLFAAWNNLGLARRQLGESAAAEADLTRAIEVRPDSHEAHANRAHARMDLGRFAEALADIDRAIELAPHTTSLLGERAVIRLNAGDPRGAVADATRALERDGQLQTAWLYRGHAHRLLGMLAEADADLTRAIELEGGDVKGWLGRGEVRHLAGDLRGAIADASEAIARSPRHAPAWCLRGTARGQAGDFDGSIADLDQAIALDDRDPRFFCNRGFAYSAKKEWRRAIEDYDATLARDPRFAQALISRAFARDALGGDDEGTLADLERALPLIAPTEPRKAIVEAKIEALRTKLGR